MFRTRAPEFVLSLFELVSTDKYQDIISFDSKGISVVIKSLYEFQKHILKLHFKNKDVQSLSRQLSLYGFIRKTDGRLNRGKGLHTMCIFQHPYFIRGRPDLLSLVSRKKLNPSERSLKQSTLNSQNYLQEGRSGDEFSKQEEPSPLKFPGSYPLLNLESSYRNSLNERPSTAYLTSIDTSAPSARMAPSMHSPGSMRSILNDTDSDSKPAINSSLYESWFNIKAGDFHNSNILSLHYFPNDYNLNFSPKTKINY